jgi:ClpX C4-type zinc finger
MRCPLCAQSVDGGELVTVCQPCHQTLGAALEVSATGEFRVAPVLAQAAERPARAATLRGTAPPLPPPSAPPARPASPAAASAADSTEDAVASPGSAPPPFAAAVAPRCAWCGKREDEVRKLLGRGAVALCEECIALAADILDAELGEWR